MSASRARISPRALVARAAQCVRDRGVHQDPVGVVEAGRHLDPAVGAEDRR